MLIFKKILPACLSFILIVFVVSYAIIRPFLFSDAEDFLDNSLRDSLAGTLDYLVVGSCQGKYAFVPEILDEELGCTSYNLCGLHMSPNGKFAILSEELERNPVKNVIIDIDYDQLSYTTRGIRALGDISLLPRLGVSRVEYFFKNVHPEDYHNIYSEYLFRGIMYQGKKLLGQETSAVNPSEKGHRSSESTDFTIKPENCIKTRQSEQLKTEIVENNDEKLSSLISVCKEKGINVILIMPPSADNYVWTYSGWDEIRKNLLEIAEQNDVQYLDFNLFKEKNVLLNDKESYQDLWHLSVEGSKVFTERLCDVLKDIENGKDVSEQFYGSYEEVLQHSPYAAG